MTSNLNAALDQVRSEELRKASEMDRGVIANSRYLLLRGKENVPEYTKNRDLRANRGRKPSPREGKYKSRACILLFVSKLFERVAGVIRNLVGCPD